MDNQRSLLSLAYFCQGKSMEELRESLLLTTVELEATRLKAQEELKMRDDQLIHLKDMLSKAIRERDEAQNKCQRLLLEKFLLQQQQQLQQAAHFSGISSIEDEPRRGLDSNNGFSSSDCEESIVSSPVIDPIPPPQAPPLQTPAEPAIQIVPEKPMPEKGKFLQAVMKAGPLLQTLLLAGPLPQWRHPPPALDSYQIPLPQVTIPPPQPPTHHLHQESSLNNRICNSIDNCARVNRKRGFSDGTDSPTESKYGRVVAQ